MAGLTSALARSWCAIYVGAPLQIPSVLLPQDAVEIQVTLHSGGAASRFGKYSMTFTFCGGRSVLIRTLAVSNDCMQDSTSTGHIGCRIVNTQEVC